MTKPTRPAKQLISLNEAAAYAACSPKTIRRRIADGSLTGYRLGRRLVRVDQNELDELFDEIPTGA